MANENHPTIALVFALREELRPILKESKIVSQFLEKKTRLLRAEFRGTGVIFCQTGIGLADAHEGTERLLEHFQPSLILSAGYAGGADPSLKTGDLVIPDEVRSETPTDHFKTDPKGRERLGMLAREEGVSCRTGPLVTLWKMGTRRDKEAWGQKGALAVDMESAAIAAVAAKQQVPFVSLRVIFDPAGEDLPFGTSPDQPDVGMALLKNPKGLLQIPKFFRMNRVCQRNLCQIVARVITSRAA